MTGALADVLDLIAVLVLTAGTAVFVAAEISLTSLERSQVDSHVRQIGDTKAKRVAETHRTLSFQLSGAQLGITITTLVTGYLAEPSLADLLSGPLTLTGLPRPAVDIVASVVALALATGFSMAFGELVPKNVAIARPLPTARAVAGVQYWFSRLFSWPIKALNGSANWVVRRFGVEPAEDLRSARSPQELGSLVRTSAAQGTLEAGTASILDRSLRFIERTAEELMTPRLRIEALRAEDTVLDLIAAARRTGFSRFPVYDDDLDSIRGIVHVKQAFGVPAAQHGTTKLRNMAHPVPNVPSSLDGDTLLNRLRGSGLQIAAVVDEYGGTAGLVTLEDVIEEIVGDVRDEHDRLEPPPVRPLGTNSWLVSGLLRADEVMEATGFRMPAGDYETLAGLVLARLGRIPEVGAEARVDGWRITVLSMDRHRVAELRVAKWEPADSPSRMVAS